MLEWARVLWRWAEGILIFSGDVQTTFLAIAITASVLCSLGAVVIGLATEQDPAGPRVHLLQVIRDAVVTRRKRKKRTKSNSGTEGEAVGDPGVAGAGLQEVGAAVGGPAVAETLAEEMGPVVAFHLAALAHSSHGEIAPKSVWSDRKIEDPLCRVMCVRCSKNEAAKLCRYILCDECCAASEVIPACQQHEAASGEGNGSTGGGCRVLPRQVTYRSNSAEQEEKPVAVSWSGLSLERCPERMGFLGSQLTLLNLSSNTLERLPAELGCLRGLAELLIQNNLIRTLPESMGNLRNLVKLDVCNNRLQRLPDSIGFLSKVEVMLMGRNELKELPQTVGHLTQLRRFNIAFNKLEHLPESVCNLSKLVQLDVHENPLLGLPDKMDLLVRLECLNMSHCSLTTLPNSLCRCSALYGLHMSHNMLRSLPGQIGRLHQLQDLQVDHNKLLYLPASVACLSKLQFLSCVGNNLLEESDLDRQRREAPTTSRGDFTAPPSLLETAARAVTTHRVAWQHENIPKHLAVLLGRTRFCSCCEGPFCEFFRSELRFVTLSSLGLRLPLYQQICSPHLKYRCRLIPLDV